MEALAGEAAIALDRTRSASALDQALARERLVAKISRRVRSVHDLDAITRVAVTETGRAIDGSRCFIRLGESGEAMPIRAEWWADGLEPIGDAVAGLPVSNLAARERRTVAIPDVLDAPELADPSLGSVESLTRLGSRAVLATPVIVFDRMIGVLALHRPEPSAVVVRRRRPGRGGRARARPRAAHGPAAGRERAPARRAVRAAEGRPDGHERARARRGPAAARGRGGRAARAPRRSTASCSTRSGGCCAARPSTARSRASSASSSPPTAASRAARSRAAGPCSPTTTRTCRKPSRTRATRASAARSSRRCAGRAR